MDRIYKVQISLLIDFDMGIIVVVLRWLCN